MSPDPIQAAIDAANESIALHGVPDYPDGLYSRALVWMRKLHGGIDTFDFAASMGLSVERAHIALDYLLGKGFIVAVRYGYTYRYSIAAASSALHPTPRRNPMGTAYADSVANNGHVSSFHTTLTSCLTGIVHGNNNLSYVPLKQHEEPAPDGRSRNAWSDDYMVFYKGSPVVAVAVQVEGSSTNRGFHSAKLMDKLPGARPMSEAKADVGARLRAAEAAREVAPVDEAPQKPIPYVAELHWRIVLRVIGTKNTSVSANTGAVSKTTETAETVFEGIPFDFDVIEEAFDKLADILEAAIAGTPHVPGK